jgi:hypothetical protein
MSKCENCLSKNVCRWYENGTGKNLCCADDFPCPEQKDKDHFIKVPCKVGDTVFFLHNGIELCEAMIINIEDNYYTNPQMWITVEFFSKVIGTNTYKNRIDLMLGKTVFLTKEEAETEMRKRSDNNG